jgi:hypothetical protein
MTQDELQKTILTVQIWTLLHIRRNPGQTREEIVMAAATHFDRLDFEGVPMIANFAIDVYDSASVIYHEHNATNDCVFIHSDPAPVKKTNLHGLTIETAGARFDVFTDKTPEELADALKKPGENAIFFQDITGENKYIARPDDIAFLAFGRPVAEALQ